MHGMKRSSRMAGVVRLIAHRSMETAKRLRAERRAYRRMPKPCPWEWAEPRLMPLLASPFFDPPGEPLVRSVLPLGITVVFGIDLGGGVLPYVDAPVAERWECSAEQVCRAATANLSRRAARIHEASVLSGTLSGHRIRILKSPAGWASSLLLAPDELQRLFGRHDQILLAAGPGTLISMALDVPAHVGRDLVFEYEARELYPLMLDPFALIDGEVHWGGAEDWGDDDDWEPAIIQMS